LAAIDENDGVGLLVYLFAAFFSYREVGNTEQVLVEVEIRLVIFLELVKSDQ